MNALAHPAPVEVLPLVRLADIEPDEPELLWLIEDIWLRGAVGAVAGHPKSLKTWCALDLALSVASATPALGRFAVRLPAPVLVCAVEDSLQALRSRCEQMARVRGLSLAALELLFLAVPSLHLDDPRDQERLDRTLSEQPVQLLVLDPFARLVRSVDENSAAEVSRVLGFLREIQRQHDTAVLLVHHTRKNVAGAAANNLRGSSDFFAWVDSCLCLLRRDGDIVLHVEHRSARNPELLRVRLAEEPALHLVAEPAGAGGHAPEALDDQVLALLAQGPIATCELPDLVRVRKQRLVDLLKRLERSGFVYRVEKGWTLRSQRNATKERKETP